MEQLVAYWASAEYDGDALSLEDIHRVVGWIMGIVPSQDVLVAEMHREPYNGSVAAFSKMILSKEAVYRNSCNILVEKSSEEAREHFGEANLRLIAEWAMKIWKQPFHGAEGHFRAVLSGVAATKLREYGYPGADDKDVGRGLMELGDRIGQEEWKIANENLAAFATILATKFQSSLLVTDAHLRRDTYTQIGMTLSQVPVVTHHKERSQAVLIVCALRRSDGTRSRTILDHLRERGEGALRAYTSRSTNGVVKGAATVYRYNFKELQEALNTIRAKPAGQRWSKDQLAQLRKAGAYLSLFLAVEDLMIPEELLAEEMREN